MESIADDDPPSLTDLRDYVNAGRSWVSADRFDRPIAYILVDEIDQGVHIAQVTVHPQFARRGIGGALIEEVASRAAALGFKALTLITFEQVPWNGPYYKRLGFVTVPESLWSEAIHRIVELELALGLSAWPRVVMKRNLRPGE